MQFTQMDMQFCQPKMQKFQLSVQILQKLMQILQIPLSDTVVGVLRAQVDAKDGVLKLLRPVEAQ